MKFEDITEKSNINQNKGWSSGVTFSDVNNDGWLDIYISQGGPFNRTKRKNTLLINNKDLTFTENASLYGLDDQGISTQSAFFDFDKDGDLDCVVMNENEFYGYDPLTFFKKCIMTGLSYNFPLSFSMVTYFYVSKTLKTPRLFYSIIYFAYFAWFIYFAYFTYFAYFA